jgi:hypothetical protein
MSISWNTHYMISREALGDFAVGPLFNKVTVKSLEDFILEASGQLSGLASWYADLLRDVTGITVGCISENSAMLTMDDFLKSFRLNPNYNFCYVNVIDPLELKGNNTYSPSRNGPPGYSYLDVSLNDSLYAGEVFCTYSDEPDWGFDQDLFVQPGYGLGAPPFGWGIGKSSQAPFHMDFLHESRLLRKLVPGVNISFLSGRALLFEALAKLAFSVGHHYWGWRFAAWSCHYFQDITQPYHAKAFPPSISCTLSAYGRKNRDKSLKEWIGDFLRVRHVISEATTHFLINKALSDRNPHPLTEALKGLSMPVANSHQEILVELSLVAASRARQVDTALGRVIDGLGLSGLTYSPGEGIYSQVGSDLMRSLGNLHNVDIFVDHIIPCLHEAGKATRFIVRKFADIL